MDGCRKDSEALSQILNINWDWYLACSMYAEAGPGFAVVLAKSVQSPKMTTK